MAHTTLGMARFFGYLSWDYIKRLMMKAYCRSNMACIEGEIGYRVMIVSILRDSYNARGYTIFASLHGTPPKAYAIIQAVNDFNPEKDDKITVWLVKVYGPEFRHYRTLTGYYTISLAELRQRKDVRLGITSGVYTQELFGEAQG